jgi:dynein light intermediate chain 2
MSRVKHVEADDVWTKLQRNPPSKGVADGGGAGTSDSDLGANGSSLVIVGDLSSGKSTLIQTFLKPTASKDSKPTIALEYNFARRTSNGVKQVANLWEIGGDLVEPKLMEIGITLKGLPSTTVIVCCDLSKPHNLLNSVLRAISAVKETASKRVAALQATNVNRLVEMREKLTLPYKGHPYENRVRPLDVPVCIVANKHDTFKSLSSSDRRAVIQILRFVAHFFGAHLIATSSADATHRDAFRTLISNLAFGMPVKAACEVNPDKVVYVSRGADSYQKIFLESAGGAEGTNASSRSKVKNSYLSVLFHVLFV